MNVRRNTDYSELFAMLDQAMQSELPEMKLYFMIGSCVGSRQEKGAAVAAAENLYDMRRICLGDHEGKIHLLMDYTDRPGDVADPWYTRDFEATWRDVEDGCRGLLMYLTAEQS